MEWNWHTAVSIVWLVCATGLMIWLTILSFKNSTNPGLLILKWAVTFPMVFLLWWKVGPMLTDGGGGTIAGMLFAAAGSGVIAIIWRGSLIDSLVNPFVAIFDGGNEPPELKPFYSIARAKRMRGLYLEAIAEIHKQLERFPNDFEGVMMLAGIQAEDLKDLASAEITLNQFCVQPKSPPKQIAAAWTTLADWHLKIGVDVGSAEASLQKIVTHFPGTEMALQAQQRMAHLGGTEEILLAQRDRKRVILPEGVKNVGLLGSTAFLTPKEPEPGQLAAEYVKQLEAHPYDYDVREKLALIYAKDFQRLDLATLELLHLINEPRHSPKQITGWLNQLASLQIELGADVPTVRATLEQIVVRFPDSPAAEVTARRLARINSEFKNKTETPSVKLGVYEQNIGLKYGSPRKL
jgi:tetratricopeptide (TPR) repeat protein